MKAIEQAKVNFEYVFGKGFFEVVPVEEFKDKKGVCPYYQNGVIHLNKTGFSAEDLYHEAAHALDDILFSSEMEFHKFFNPHYKQLKKMNYFNEFLEGYDIYEKAHECFAEGIAMSLAHPDWEAGHELVSALIDKMSA